MRSPGCVALTEPQTFLFADLAGFTALTEAHGDEQAADLVDDFCRRARALLPAYDSEEVKAIGDALMIRSADAAQGVRLALELTTRIGARHGFPAIRVGVHTGPAVERSSDWFGAAVNLASRVSGAAAAGDVLATAATRDAASSALPTLEFRYLGSRRFKNVREPVEVYAVADPTDGSRRCMRPVVDPVCRMRVDPSRSEAHRDHRESRTASAPAPAPRRSTPTPSTTTDGARRDLADRHGGAGLWSAGGGVAEA